MKWEAVLLVTIIALTSVLCQVVVKKLQAKHLMPENKALITLHSARGGIGMHANCQVLNA
jgi:hypothetical protein